MIFRSSSRVRPCFQFPVTSYQLPVTSLNGPWSAVMTGMGTEVVGTFVSPIQPTEGCISVFARLCISMAQALSHGVASESSPRREPWEVTRWWRSPGRGDRTKSGNSFAAPRLLPCSADPPRLAPWATFWRCSAANALDSAPPKTEMRPRPSEAASSARARINYFYSSGSATGSGVTR